MQRLLFWRSQQSCPTDALSKEQTSPESSTEVPESSTEEEASNESVKKTVRLEMLHRFPLKDFRIDTAEAITLKNELFILCEPNYTLDGVVNVYDRGNLTKVKDVIKLPGLGGRRAMAACNVSNCLYILSVAITGVASVLRIAKEGEHRFMISSVILGQWESRLSDIAVAGNGNIILWSRDLVPLKLAEIVVIDANGCFQKKMKLPSDFFRLEKTIPKSNGNLVLVSTKFFQKSQYNSERNELVAVTKFPDSAESIFQEDYDSRTKLTEIDMNGTILRQYQSSLSALSSVCVADLHGRIVIIESLEHIELVDNEFNLLNVTWASEPLSMCFFPKLQYNSERNELVAVMEYPNHAVSILQFSEEDSPSHDADIGDVS